MGDGKTEAMASTDFLIMQEMIQAGSPPCRPHTPGPYILCRDTLSDAYAGS